jgi:hypothetical protein
MEGEYMQAYGSEHYKKLYYNNIRQKLNEKIKETGLTQKELAAECNKRSISATQGSISKLLGESAESAQSMPLITVAALCDILKLDMNAMLSIGTEAGGADDFASDFNRDYIASSDTLIADSDNTAFKGYNDVALDVYLYPTISYQPELLKGSLVFTKDAAAKLCRAKLTLETGRTSKVYTGILRISLQQNACYVVLSSRELGEISTIFFRHRFFSESSLKTRLACCNTISAGDSRRPTSHRAVLIEAGRDLSEEDMQLIRSQLLMNDSQIRISRKNMEALIKDEGIYGDIMGRAMAEECVVVFEESEVLLLQGYTFEQKAQAIAEMRLASFGAQRYNKSSAKSDELLFKSLFEDSLRINRARYG